MSDTTPFGWCLSGHHSECWVTVSGRTCSCKCKDHGTESQRGQLPGVSPEFAAVVEKYSKKRRS